MLQPDYKGLAFSQLYWFGGNSCSVYSTQIKCTGFRVGTQSFQLSACIVCILYCIVCMYCMHIVLYSVHVLFACIVCILYCIVCKLNTCACIFAYISDLSHCYGERLVRILQLVLSPTAIIITYDQ